MEGGRSDEADHREQPADQGDGVDVHLQPVEVLETLGERGGEQEGDEHLSAREEDPQLLEQPVVAPAQLLAVLLVVELLRRTVVPGVGILVAGVVVVPPAAFGGGRVAHGAPPASVGRPLPRCSDGRNDSSGPVEAAR